MLDFTEQAIAVWSGYPIEVINILASPAEQDPMSVTNKIQMVLCTHFQNIVAKSDSIAVGSDHMKSMNEALWSLYRNCGKDLGKK